MTEKTQSTKSSGNICRDLEFERPEEWQAKAHLAAHILGVLEERGLTQVEAARILGVSQPEVSNLKRGRLDRFTFDRLFRFLAALQKVVEITIVPPAEGNTEGTVMVREAPGVYRSGEEQ